MHLKIIASALFIIIFSGLPLRVYAANRLRIEDVVYKQLHSSYEETPHRYMLSARLVGGQPPFRYSWKVNCGTISGSSTTAEVLWWYAPPGSCAGAAVALAVLDANNEGQALVKTIFYTNYSQVKDIKTASEALSLHSYPATESAAPRLKNITVKRLHESENDRPHRYQLTVVGDNLDHDGLWFAWEPFSCGKIVGTRSDFALRTVELVIENPAHCFRDPEIQVRLVTELHERQILTRSLLHPERPASFVRSPGMSLENLAAYQVKEEEFRKKIESFTKEDCYNAWDEYDQEMARYQGFSGFFRHSAYQLLDRAQLFVVRLFGAKYSSSVPQIDTSALDEKYAIARACQGRYEYNEYRKEKNIPFQHEFLTPVEVLRGGEKPFGVTSVKG